VRFTLEKLGSTDWAEIPSGVTKKVSLPFLRGRAKPLIRILPTSYCLKNHGVILDLSY